MRIIEKNDVVVVSDVVPDVSEYIANFEAVYADMSCKNLVLDMRGLKTLKKTDLKSFSRVSKAHKKLGRSFVIVQNTIHPTTIPDILTVVPTLQEAYDVISFEEMERDLSV